jgi:hypothetical protein
VQPCRAPLEAKVPVPPSPRLAEPNNGWILVRDQAERSDSLNKRPRG